MHSAGFPAWTRSKRNHSKGSGSIKESDPESRPNPSAGANGGVKTFWAWPLSTGRARRAFSGLAKPLLPSRGQCRDDRGRGSALLPGLGCEVPACKGSDNCAHRQSLNEPWPENEPQAAEFWLELWILRPPAELVPWLDLRRTSASPLRIFSRRAHPGHSHHPPGPPRSEAAHHTPLIASGLPQLHPWNLLFLPALLLNG